MTPTTHDALMQLDPAEVKADANIRYGIKPEAVSTLKAQILDFGSVHTPIEVERLTPAENGFKYRLTVGHIRHAAVTAINAEGGGLTLPALIRPAGTPADRLRRQLSENLDRESMSPMDRAAAIKALLDAGVARKDIARYFSRPSGPKGAVVPVSNAFLNMHVSFLNLPKSIQDKIHEGRVGVEAAYELTRLPADRRADVLARAEADVEARRTRTERVEAAFAKDEEKVNDAKSKEVTALESVEAAQKALMAAEEKRRATKAAFDAASQVPADYKELPKKEKEAHAERRVMAHAAHKAAVTAVAAVEKALEKAQDKAKTAAATVEERAKRLAEARRKAPAKKAAAKAGRGKTAGAVGATDIKRAAVTEGVGDGQAIPLKAAEMRVALGEMKIATYPTVNTIIETIEAVFAGSLTPIAATRKLADLVKEPKRPTTKAAAAAKA